MRQIRCLTALELRNLYGLNVIRHIKDPGQKKKTKVFACVIVFLLLVVLSYIVALCAGLGVLGAAKLIPAYLIVMESGLILFFDIFKVSGVIFRQKGYDIMTSFPVTDGAIVVSRFLRMYVESLLVGVFVFVPGMAVYAAFEHPAVTSYALACIVMLLAPLLPLAVAVLIGTVITAIASRMKHKSLMEAALVLLVVTGVMLLTMNLSGTQEEFTLAMLQRFTELATEAIQKTYPPALILGAAIVEGKALAVAGFAMLSVMVLAGVMWIVTCKYHAICCNLYTVTAKHDYKLETLKTNTVKRALVMREARRYFASGPYVSNTIIGPAFGALIGVAFLFVDVENVFAQMMTGMPVSMNIRAAMPLMVAGVMTMMNAVSISVSMEGKEWWILKSLPLDTKTVLDGKLMFNFLLVAPFFAVSQICLWIALVPPVAEAVVTFVLSALLLIFSSVFALRINLLFPKFDWENETVAVKQSASSFLGGIGGVIVTFLFVLPVVFLPQNYFVFVCIAECVIVGGLVRGLYVKNNRADFSEIG